eukprot:COSAG02_NODE_11522_length_1707_cov_1.296020_2_plen_130_part_00
MASGDLEAAVDHLNTALVYDNADVAVLVQRAQVQLRRKLYDKAVADATVALKVDAGLRDAWKIIAQAEFSRGCYNACVEACESAPDSAQLKELLSKVQTIQNNQTVRQQFMLSSSLNASLWCCRDASIR